MNSKNFTTFEQQIEILKSRNLKFGSEETALKSLQRFGYYNIINGYKDPYIETVNGKEQYKEGTTFEQIFSLYKLDREIRNSLLQSMLEIEDNLKTAISHTIAEAFSEDQNMYLSRRNYRLGKRKENGYQLDAILNKFNKIANDDVQPIKHYRDNYNNIPPWILLKNASFGNTVNFIKLQKSQQKDRIISLIYEIPPEFLQSGTELKDLFMDTLFVCLDYRNIAAHGGRIYNCKTNSTFRYSQLLHKPLNITEADYRNGKGKTGLTVLAKSIEFFGNKNPFVNLYASIEFFIKEHCDLFPNDKDYLLKYLEIY